MVRAGEASIAAPSGSAMVITQSTPTAIISWNDFSIGAGGQVRFDNGSGATLNRVTGAEGSRIDGALTASGSVYLLNPNGVVIGRSGVVEVGGGFVASTLDVGDAAFGRRGTLSFSGASRAAVLNLGRVSALGGDVALIATQVRNDGALNAPRGSVALAAGSTVLVRDGALDGGRIAVLVGGGDTSATNAGTIAAAVAELRAAGGSVYALAGNMGGIIRASTVRHEGGRIFLTADTVTVAPGATLDASGTAGGGAIVAIADRALRFSGTALARGGSGVGGSVETSGATVDFAGASVDTAGAASGTWLVDPTDLTVDAAAAATINRNLATTNVTLQTTASSASGPGVVSNGVGDITIAAPLSWSSANLLTLDAYHAIRVNAPIAINGAGKLTLDAASDNSGVLLSFGRGSAVRFNGAANSGRALTINGQAYRLIDRFDQLTALSGAGLGGAYALARPLNAGGPVYTDAAIGPGGAAFTGTLEGLGNSISGLTIRAPGVVGVGLFSVLLGTARDLNLTSGSIVGGGGYAATPSGSTLYAGTGALAGRVGQMAAFPAIAGGVVTNVTSTLSVTGQSRDGEVSYTGGLIGYLGSGFVTGSSSSGAVRGSLYVGGLIGWIDNGGNDGGVVTRSSASGNVTGGSDVGGLIGHMQRAEVSFVSAQGNVTGHDNVGGLVGGAVHAPISDARASGNVTGPSSNQIRSGNIGGLAGSVLLSSVTRSTATGAVSGYEDIGGLVGMLNGTVSDSQASGIVRGHTDVGGLVGGAQANSFYIAPTSLTITDSQASGAVSGATHVGGLLGYGTPDPFNTVNTVVTGSRATGSVTGSAGSTDLGGLIGSVSTAYVADDVASGRVIGEANVGGLIGVSYLSTISRNAADGDVQGIAAGRNVGGLIGYSIQDAIAGARANNAVLGRINVGGLIGFRDGGSLSDVAATGPVRGSTNVGRLIGYDSVAGGPLP